MTGLLEPLLPSVGYLALLLRVFLGANFIIHARPKLGKGMAQTRQWIVSMGIPGGAAYAATMLELFGGLFFIIGLIVPVVAIFFAVEMVANSIMKKTKMSADYINPGKTSYEVDVLYLVLCVALIVLGAGAFSLDGIIGL